MVKTSILYSKDRIEVKTPRDIDNVQPVRIINMRDFDARTGYSSSIGAIGSRDNIENHVFLGRNSLANYPRQSSSSSNPDMKQPSKDKSNIQRYSPNTGQYSPNTGQYSPNTGQYIPNNTGRYTAEYPGQYIPNDSYIQVYAEREVDELSMGISPDVATGLSKYQSYETPVFDSRQEENRERERKDHEKREREIYEREIYEREKREREKREREKREREKREREIRERQLREKELREMHDSEIRERQAREREKKENDRRADRIREQQMKELNLQKEKQIRELEVKERIRRERETQREFQNHVSRNIHSYVNNEPGCIQGYRGPNTEGYTQGYIHPNQPKELLNPNRIHQGYVLGSANTPRTMDQMIEHNEGYNHNVVSPNMRMNIQEHAGHSRRASRINNESKKAAKGITRDRKSAYKGAMRSIEKRNSITDSKVNMDARNRKYIAPVKQILEGVAPPTHRMDQESRRHQRPYPIEVNQRSVNKPAYSRPEGRDPSNDVSILSTVHDGAMYTGINDGTSIYVGGGVHHFNDSASNLNSRYHPVESNQWRGTAPREHRIHKNGNKGYNTGSMNQHDSHYRNHDLHNRYNTHGAPSEIYNNTDASYSKMRNTYMENPYHIRTPLRTNEGAYTCDTQTIPAFSNAYTGTTRQRPHPPKSICGFRKKHARKLSHVSHVSANKSITQPLRKNRVSNFFC